MRAAEIWATLAFAFAVAVVVLVIYFT